MKLLYAEPNKRLLGSALKDTMLMHLSGTG
jgi:hypothetical protein